MQPLPGLPSEHQPEPTTHAPPSRARWQKPEHASPVINPGTHQRLADAILVAFNRFRRPPPGAWPILLAMTRATLAHSEEYLGEGVPYSVRRISRLTGRSRGEVGRAFQWFHARGILVNRRNIEVKRRYFLYHVASPRVWRYEDDRPAPTPLPGDLGELVDDRWPVPVISFPKYWNAGAAGGVPRRPLDKGSPVSQDPETLPRGRRGSGTLRSRAQDQDPSRSRSSISAEKPADILQMDTWYIRSGRFGDGRRWSLAEAAGMAIEALHPELWDVAPTDPWSLPARLVGDVADYFEALGTASWTRDNVRVAIIRAVQRRAQLLADAADARRRAVEADERRRSQAVQERVAEIRRALGPVAKPAGLLAEVLAGAAKLATGDVIELAIVEVLAEELAQKVDELRAAREVLALERQRCARAREERLQREAAARELAAAHAAEEAAKADVPSVAAAIGTHAAALDELAAALNQVCSEPSPRQVPTRSERAVLLSRRAAATASQLAARSAWRAAEHARAQLLAAAGGYVAELDVARRALASALRARDQAREALAFLKREGGGPVRVSHRVPPEHDGTHRAHETLPRDPAKNCPDPEDSSEHVTIGTTPGAS